MPFSFAPYLVIDTEFFRVSTLAIILVLQIITGTLLPGQSHNPPHLWWFAHSLMNVLAKKLDRAHRSAAALKLRGFLSFLFMLLVGWGVAVLGEELAARIPYGWLAVPFLIWGSVNVVVPWRVSRVLIASKDLKDMAAKSAGLADLTGLKFDKKDSHAVPRAALMYLAYTLLRYLVAPVLAYGVFGLKGLTLYVFSGIGAHFSDLGGSKRAFFGMFRLVQNLFDYIPARGCALLIYLASILTPTASPRECLRLVFNGGRNNFPGIAFPPLIKAFAGAANTSLGGSVVFQDGEKRLYPWIGPDRASAKTALAEVKRGFVLHIYASVFVLLILLLVITS